MKKNRLKKLRYGGTAIVITVLVLCAAVILNVICAMLAARYEWMYVNMNVNTVYSISDNCRDYVDEYVISEIDRQNGQGGEKNKIKITFCDSEKNIKQDETLKNIYDSIMQLVGMFPDHIETGYLDVWEDPSTAREYGVTSTADVICEFDGRHETVNFADFYITDPQNPDKAIAYNGEKIIASCLIRVTSEEAAHCYFTVNHGERIQDLSLMKVMIEAGYTVGFLVLSSDEIPEDCELLITYAPERDASVSEGGVDEIAVLEEYMLSGGRYMMFVDADTYAAGGHENFEGLLEARGVTFDHYTSKDGIEQSYHIRDMANSLTVDGYTVLSENATTGMGAKALSGANYPNAFGNATSIRFSKDFSADGNGNYTKSEGGIIKTAAPLLVTHSSAQAWMGGIAVARADEQPFVLMSVTKGETDAGKTGYLVACTSTEFASQDKLQSAVLGNSRTITEIIRFMGRENAPADISFKSFSGTKIESLATSVANTYAIVLAAVPTAIVAIAGAVVLIRRKFL